MASPDSSHAMKVGVLLTRDTGDLAGWLAEGAAFDAAGADVLWAEVAPEPETDPLAVLAALAAVTSRSLLVTSVPPAGGPPPDVLGRTLATIGRLSRGRLRILTDGPPPDGLDDVCTELGVFHRAPDNPDAYEYGAERWASTSLPDSRATWRATVLDAAERGIRGLLVPADPRLVDLLRNPDDPGPRRDLQLAQG